MRFAPIDHHWWYKQHKQAFQLPERYRNVLQRIATITSLSELRFRSLILLIENKEAISMNSGTSKSS